MSIETLLQNLIDAVNANTAAIKAAGTGAAATAEAPTATAEKQTRTRAKKDEAAKPAGPKHTKAEMQAALNEVREAMGTAKAKELIKNAGFDKLADVTEDKFDELYDAAKALLAAEEGDEGEDL